MIVSGVAVSKRRKERYEQEGIPTPIGDNETVKIRVKTKDRQ